MDDPAITSTDILINRVVDHDAETRDWVTLAERARADEGVWTTLNAALRADCAVMDIAAGAGERGGRVDLPRDVPAGATRPSAAPRFALARLAPWSGWAAAAAALALLVIVKRGISTESSAPEGIRTLTVSSPRTADEALRHYVRLGTDEGRILDELPLVTVDAEQAADGGGYEVVYLRRFIERRHVADDGVFKFVADEHGRAVVVPSSPQPHRVRKPI